MPTIEVMRHSVISPTSLPATGSESVNQPRRRSARQAFAAFITSAKNIFHASISNKATSIHKKQISKSHISSQKQAAPPSTPRKHLFSPSARKVKDGRQSGDDVHIQAAQYYRVASAAQLNGRYVQEALRVERNAHTSAPPSTTQSMRDRYGPPLSVPLVRSRSTPILIDVPLPPVPPKSDPNDEDEEGTEKTYSPVLSTITESAEPEMIRPISEILSIGEARLLPILSLKPSISTHNLTYETAITRFAAKATKLIHCLGPEIEIYADREAAVQSEAGPSFDRHAEYFKPMLSRLFTRIAVCDSQLPGEPIRFASRAFELSSASLTIGECHYLNLGGYKDSPKSDNGRAQTRVVLRTEYDELKQSTKYVIHFALPAYDEALKKHWEVVSQVDVTNPLRRLALQEFASTSHDTKDFLERDPISSQMQRFLAFIHHFSTLHSNVLLFNRSSASTTTTKRLSLPLGEEGENADWQLKFAARDIFADPAMVVHVGEGAANRQEDMQHMALMMDGEEEFCQGMVWGHGESEASNMRTVRPTTGAKDSSVVGEALGSDETYARGAQKVQRRCEQAPRSFLQYCIPVTDGRADAIKEKWWVGFLIDKEVPGFWPKSEGSSVGGADDSMEWPYFI